MQDGGGEIVLMEHTKGYKQAWSEHTTVEFSPAPAAGRTRSFIGNKDFLTIKNPVTDTFSALSSIKVLKIWTLDSS